MTDGLTPFDRLGGIEPVTELANRFYDAMERDEPELTAVHRLIAPGRVHPESRAAFALFLVFWLGGPPQYLAVHGHPRLRMRHNHIAVDSAHRDAWLRAMTTAMNEMAIAGEVRDYLDHRFATVAEAMRNTPDAPDA